MLYWSPVNPKELHEMPLLSPEVTVWWSWWFRNCRAVFLWKWQWRNSDCYFRTLCDCWKVLLNLLRRLGRPHSPSFSAGWTVVANMDFSKREQSFCFGIRKNLVRCDCAARISSRIPEGSTCFQQYQKVECGIPGRRLSVHVSSAGTSRTKRRNCESH